MTDIITSIPILLIRCEADPAALAKYVLALIKKDKSEEELRKSMIEQLDVFLEAGRITYISRSFGSQLKF